MNLRSAIESLLFVSDHPLAIKDFSNFIEYEKDASGPRGTSAQREIEKTLEELCEDYRGRDSGIEIIKHQKKYQMVSSPDNSDAIQKFLKDETTGELTRPQLETLTTIAYRGPITKPELEQIRGVNCSLVLRNLMMRGLVADTDQRFSITLDFLKFLGIRNVKELPDYEKLSNHEIIEEVLSKND